MKVELEVELPDTPGQLVKCLEPISRLGGNILRISHHRDRKRGQLIPVSINFEVQNVDLLDSIKNMIERQGIRVFKCRQEFVGFKQVVIIIGHVFQRDITNTIDRILDCGVLVSEVNARITQKEEVSTVKFSILGDTEKQLHDAVEVLHEICEEKDLFLIRS